jgi:hypothetical protein
VKDIRWVSACVGGGSIACKSGCGDGGQQVKVIEVFAVQHEDCCDRVAEGLCNSALSSSRETGGLG